MAHPLSHALERRAPHRPTAPRTLRCSLAPTLQAWRSDVFFDNIFHLVGVPVITVQLRYDGWVTEMQGGPAVMRDLQGGARGLDNLLYRCGRRVLGCWGAGRLDVCVGGRGGGGAAERAERPHR